MYLGRKFQTASAVNLVNHNSLVQLRGLMKETLRPGQLYIFSRLKPKIIKVLKLQEQWNWGYTQRGQEIKLPINFKERIK